MRSPAFLALALVLPAVRLHAGGDSLRPYGSPTPGSGGRAPVLWAGGTPRPGDSGFALTVTDGLGGASGVVLLSAGRSNVNVGGLRILIDTSAFVDLPPFVLAGNGAGNGRATLPLPLPNSASLIGASLHGQAFVVDPGGAFLGIAASRGLTMRPARSGMLLVTRSVGGAADAQIAIDLASGRTADFSAGKVNNGNGVAFSRGASHASHAFVLAGLGRSLVVYDARTFPPRHVTSVPTQRSASPWTVSVTPDGLRAYVVNQGSRSVLPVVEVLWAAPGGPNFGKPFPGGGIALGTVRDALAMRFSPDGNTGYLGSLGLVGGPASVRRYDTRVGSATYHKQTAIVSFPGKFMFDFEVSPDGATIYAPVGPLAGNTEIMLVDAATFRLIDVDPGAPGIQGIGGERSLPRVPTGRVLGGIVAGPLGRYLYVSTAGPSGARVLRIEVDRSRSTFRRYVVHTQGLPARGTLGGLALSDAGDRLYVAARSGGVVQELDTATMRVLRTWRITSPGMLAYR